MNGPVFIVGCPRSGTTLLGVMLDRHSEIAVTPETAFYDEIAPNVMPGFDLNLVLGEWPRLPELGLDVPQVVRRCGPAPTSAGLLGGLLKLYAESRGKARAGEKTPQHIRHVPRILEEFPNARVLCMVRDGRAVALSLRSMPWWPNSLSTGVDAWLEAIRLSGAMAAEYPESFLIVRYEELVDRPEATLESVMSFVDLQFEAGQLRPGASGVVLSRSLAWKGLALGPVDVSRLSHWRRAACTGELDYLNEVLGPTLERLGYPVREDA